MALPSSCEPIIPTAFLSGGVFPLATRVIDPQSRDAAGSLIARAYSWNTVGARTGSLLAGFVIAVLFDFFQAIYLLAVFYGLTAFIAVIFILKSNWASLPYRFPVAAVGLLSLIVIFFGMIEVSESERFVKRFNKHNESFEGVSHQPGLQGVTSVVRRGNETLGSLLLVNGTGMTLKVTDTKMMAHLPMMLHKNPENTLVICFGMGTTYRSAVSYGKRVTVVELVEEVFDAFGYFYADYRPLRSYPQGRMINNDGRNFLQLTRERFDVITVDPPPPIDAAGVNHLYSKDFIDLARSRLNPGGIMAHWIPYPAAEAGVDDWFTFNMLVDTFVSAFPHVSSVPGWHEVGLHLLGSNEPIEVSSGESNNVY